MVCTSLTNSFFFFFGNPPLGLSRHTTFHPVFSMRYSCISVYSTLKSFHIFPFRTWFSKGCTFMQNFLQALCVWVNFNILLIIFVSIFSFQMSISILSFFLIYSYQAVYRHPNQKRVRKNSNYSLHNHIHMMDRKNSVETVCKTIWMYEYSINIILDIIAITKSILKLSKLTKLIFSSTNMI